MAITKETQIGKIEVVGNINQSK